MAADPAEDPDQSCPDESPPTPPETVAPPSPVVEDIDDEGELSQPCHDNDEEELSQPCHDHDEEELSQPAPAPPEAEAEVEAVAAEAAPESSVLDASPRSAYAACHNDDGDNDEGLSQPAPAPPEAEADVEAVVVEAAPDSSVVEASPRSANSAHHNAADDDEEDELSQPAPAPPEAEAEAEVEAAAAEAEVEAVAVVAEAAPESSVVKATPRSTYTDSPAASSITTVRQGHARSNSFQRFRQQVQRAWRWGSTGNTVELMNSSIREQALRATANLEVMANQKRQWYRFKSKSRDYKEPTSLFEHFVIVGLHSHANVEAIEDAFAKRKIWESKVAKSEFLDLRKLQYHGHMPTLEPQIVFKYPPAKRVAMKERELPAFCFPLGVKARLIEKTPSMSDLNEIVLGQDHLARDDLSFVFCFKGSDDAPLYGVCLHIQEILQRAPGILGAVSPTSPSKPSRFLVSAPRCYCLLTKVPFFELHFEMLNSIIAQERLDRITNFVSGMTPLDPVPLGVNLQEEQDSNSRSPHRVFLDDWTGYAIPVDSVSGLISYSCQSEREVPPFNFRNLEPSSPESASVSEVSDIGQQREFEKDRRVTQSNDDYISESSCSRSDSFERLNACFENGETSPDVGAMYSSVNGRLYHDESLESIYSSAKDAGSDEEDTELNTKHETRLADEKVMEWAKANNNETLQIVCGYHALSLPPRGGEVIFYPLEHLQPVRYFRPGISSLELGPYHGKVDGKEPKPKVSNGRKTILAAAEEALALSVWTVAAVCRALSLETMLALFTGALLEKQVVIICPNLGMLSAIVLSIIPMIRPFQWQSLLLPVLPRKLMDFLDAPVPYIVGIQKKAEFKTKTANLVRIDVSKDQAKSSGLPQLPSYKELISDLRPIHARLLCENSVAKKHPVHKCSEVQAEGAMDFLHVMRCYLESLCSNLRSHTITNVQSNNDKVFKASSSIDKYHFFLKRVILTLFLSMIDNSSSCL